MSELTIAALCHALANITNNRCSLIETANTCRCVDIMSPITQTNVGAAAPNIMLSEIFLIFFVLALWFSAIGFCLNQYKSLRRLETQVHYFVNRKDPLNIGEIKIVAREQDSIIYKKKRYSTLLDTHINPEELKAMHYVQQYLPKRSIKKKQSAISALVINRDDLTANVPLSTANEKISLMNGMPITHHEVNECQSPMLCYRTDIESDKLHTNVPLVHRTVSVHCPGALAVPYISTPSSLRSSWNNTYIYETSASTQHLCVPSKSPRLSDCSFGNISLPVPQIVQKNSDKSDEQLLNPRLISETVRRSLLALHRESQENLNVLKRKEKTQSENDVHGSFAPWKNKMKTKLKRTHHHNETHTVSNTLSLLPIRRHYSNDHDRRLSDYVNKRTEYRFSTPPSHQCSRATTPTCRRNIQNIEKYSTQSTIESETGPGDLLINNTDNRAISKTEKLTETIIEGVSQ